jgi:hypothetical protein
MYIVIRNNNSLNEKMWSSSYENKSINFIFILIFNNYKILLRFKDMLLKEPTFVYPNFVGCSKKYIREFLNSRIYFLVHLTSQGGILPSCSVHPPSYVVRLLVFHIFIFSSETSGSLWTKLSRDRHWMVPILKCIRTLSKMAVIT